MKKHGNVTKKLGNNPFYFIYLFYVESGMSCCNLHKVGSNTPMGVHKTCTNVHKTCTNVHKNGMASIVNTWQVYLTEAE